MKASDQIAEELRALTNLPDAEIDTSDVPEVEDWTSAVRGRFRQKEKQPFTGKSEKRVGDQQKT